VGIQLKSTHLSAAVDVLNIELLVYSATDKFEWMLILNPTVAGTFTYSSLGSDAAINYATGATANTVSGGTALAGGFGTSDNKGSAVFQSIDNALRLGSTISGTADTIVLCIRPVGGSTALTVEGGINIRQFS